MLDQIINIKIETCLQLAEGRTNKEKADDFKNKVMKATKLTKLGFETTGVCALAYNRLLTGVAVNSILNESF